MQKLYSLLIGIGLVITAATTASAYDNIDDPWDAYYAVVNEGAYILDVRTAEEFIWVGHPNVIPDNIVNLPWEIVYKKQWILNPTFISDANEIFEDAKGTHIIVMCRSGKRSVAASVALEENGFTHVSNMTNGFEGDVNKVEGLGYRTLNGWKNSGLPGHTSSVGADDYYQD